ncbi:MAG: putative LPS assembly protein LptD [Bacteroidota bacterium]
MAFAIFFSFQADCQSNDSLHINSEKDSIVVDTLNVLGDRDSLVADSLLLGADFKSQVKYTADDSTVYDLANDKVYLYGNAYMEYTDIKLNANYIELNFTDKVLFAKGLPDSSGSISGKPVFKQGSEEFHSETMTYNFETKKGRITQISTQEGESYIKGETVKKLPDNTTFIKNGLYTTCSEEHPHYYIYSSKIKVIPDNKILTGPANLVIADIPTPLFIPFGFFPNKKGRSSGILFPAYGQSDRGFYLQNGGYYFGLSDHFDAALTGEVFTLGSWKVNAQTNYSWRYRFNGNLITNYSRLITSERELPDYRIDKDFFIIWNHSQDAKARPNSSFSANVNAGSSSYYQNNLSSVNNFLTNTFNSSISYSKIWPSKPYSFAASLKHSQNTQTKSVSLNLPSATFNVSRIYPFKKSISKGDVRWFEKIGVSYSSSFENIINTYDTLLFKQGWEKNFMYGLQHNIPISTTIVLLKYINISPSINYAEKWYLETKRINYNLQEDSIITSQKQGFRAARDMSLGASLGTSIYGLLQFKHGKIATIRHVIRPSISYAFKPNLVNEKQGIYRYYPSSTGDAIKYSIYDGAVFGGPSDSKSSVINFNIDNNLEMKWKQVTDSSINLKKIKLLESLAIGTSYNLLADSFPLSQIGLSARTVMFDRLNIDYSASFDPYSTDINNNRINDLELDENGRLARFLNSNLSASINLTHRNKEYSSNVGSEQEMKEINTHKDEYIDFNVPFNLAIGYNAFFKSEETTVAGEKRITQTIRFNGDLSLTPSWKVTFNSGYDFTGKQWSTTYLGFFRDLHCWELKFNWIPFGLQQRYDFQINVKSSVLQDLKLTKKSKPSFD